MDKGIMAQDLLPHCKQTENQKNIFNVYFWT